MCVIQAIEAGQIYVTVPTLDSYLFYFCLYQKHEFEVAMTCEGCSGAVSRILNKLGGEVQA